MHDHAKQVILTGCGKRPVGMDKRSMAMPKARYFYKKGGLFAQSLDNPSCIYYKGKKYRVLKNVPK